MDNISAIIEDGVITKGNGDGNIKELYQMLNNDIQGRSDKNKIELFVADVKVLVKDCNKTFQKLNKNHEDFVKATKDEKYKKIEVITDDFIEKHMDCLNSKTIEAVLLEEGHTAKYDPIKRKLVNMLFLTHKAKFAEIFRISIKIEDVKFLVRLDKIENVKELDYNSTDIIELYGIKHLIVSSRRDLEALNINPNTVDISELIVKSMDKKKLKLKNSI